MSSQYRYFWASQYHWGIPNPEVDLVIQHVHQDLTDFKTIYISIWSVGRIVSRYHRETIRIRCRLWESNSHPLENDGEFIGYHTFYSDEDESQETHHLIHRLLVSIETAHFWSAGISSPWSGNHTPTPEPHSPLPINFTEPTPEGPPTPPEDAQLETL